MAKLAKVILTVLLVVLTFHVLLQTRSGILRSATAIETSTTQAPNAQKNQKQLRQLLLERKRILDAIAEDAKRSFEAGRASMLEYTDAKTASLTAGIDLCETKDDRLRIHTEIVKLHRKSEALAKRRFEHGAGGQVDLSKVKVARIDSEIDLLREQLK